MKNVYIIANWKMQQTPEQALAVARDLVAQSKKEKIKTGRQVVICPTFTELPAVAKILPSRVALGAQDVAEEDYGALTGNVSAATLKYYGCQYVIVGHSERRTLLHETNAQVNKKLKQALAQGLTPIMCVGETLIEKQSGKREAVLLEQLNEGLQDVQLAAGQKILIAYEPVWVIGSGQAVDPDEAERVQAMIKRVLLELFSARTVSDDIGILYGGSVNSSNVESFLRQPSIDGVLVGGASLTLKKFWPLINY
jgi:triosephosphate isomerase